MSDELTLFAVLCLIYVTDCFLLVGRQSVAFVTGLGRTWRVASTEAFIGTPKGGLVLLNPLPPLGQVLCSHPPPWSLSPQGVCPVNSQTLYQGGLPETEAASVAYNDLVTISARGRDLYINEEKFCTFGKPPLARRAARLIESLRGMTEAEREPAIRAYWKEQFDHEAARNRFEEAWARRRRLRTACQIMFVYLFVAAPGLVLYFQRPLLLLPLAGGMVLLALYISVEFYRTHQRLYPHSREARITGLVQMVLCPPVAIRAPDLITAPLLGAYHPLVVGLLVLSGEHFEKFAARTLRHLKYSPLDRLADRPGAAIAQWQNQLLLELAADFLDRQAHLQDDPLAPPRPGEPGLLYYCPRCLGQFTFDPGECPECPGITVVAFGHRDSAAGAKD